MKRSIVILALTVLVGLLFCACKAEAPKLNNKNFDAVKQLILTKAQSEFGDIKGVEIIFSSDMDFGFYYYFECTGNEKYVGMMIQNGDDVRVNVAPLDLSRDFSFMMSSGDFAREYKDIVLYWACAGHINNQKIETIRVVMTDKTIHEIKIDSTRAYNLVFDGSQPVIENIEGFDGQDILISSWR